MFRGYNTTTGYPNEKSKYIPSCYNFSAVYLQGIEYFFLTVGIIATTAFIVSLAVNAFSVASVFIPIAGGAWGSFVFNKIISRGGQSINNRIYKDYIIPIEATYSGMSEHDRKVYSSMLIDAYKLAEKYENASSMKRKEKETLESLAALFLRRRVSESNDLMEKIQFENQIIDNTEKSMVEAMDWNKNV